MMPHKHPDTRRLRNRRARQRHGKRWDAERRDRYATDPKFREQRRRISAKYREANLSKCRERQRGQKDVSRARLRYRLSEAASMVGLTPGTLAYFEKVGILPAERDETKGWRYYTAQALAALTVALESCMMRSGEQFVLDEERLKSLMQHWQQGGKRHGSREEEPEA